MSHRDGPAPLEKIETAGTSARRPERRPAVSARAAEGLIIRFKNHIVPRTVNSTFSVSRNAIDPREGSGDPVYLRVASSSSPSRVLRESSSNT